MDKKTIGERLRELRGDTPRIVVSEAVGIKVSTLQMYENGERIPRDENKKKLAEYYKVSVEKLFFTI